MSTRALRHDQRRMEVFPAGRSAAIIQVITSAGQTHFIAVLEANREKVLIADFPHDPFWYSQADLKGRSGWNGVALHLAKADQDLPQPNSFAGRALFWGLLGVPIAIAVAVGCRRWPRRKHRTVGAEAFTLIELLVVLAIIGLLISSADARSASRSRKCAADAMPIAIAAIRVGARQL